MTGHDRETGRTIGMILRIAVAAGLVLATVGCASTNEPPSPGESLEERVQRHFERSAGAVAQKEGLSGTPTLAYANVETITLSDGTKVSLWATTADAEHPLRSCYYLDQESRNGGASGVGGCGGRDEKVSMNRQGTVLFGSVGSWPATQIGLTGEGMDVTVNVVNGYFMTLDSGTGTYRVSLFGANQERIGAINAFTPPGSAIPS